MPRPLELAYGPPGEMGVKSLQYLSASEADYTATGLHGLVKPLGAVAVGAWLFGALTGRQELQRGAFAASVALFAVGVLTRP